ncbi:hypothetical protein CJF31_00009935 [Rutstroemia sp. NJR-2017a BVV2]|nr:hypothetical protein CJF31_00009935 [Rutstroemia sp. NJR-2017a BVV2]
MASGLCVKLSPSNAGVYHVSHIPPESFETANRLLQMNHDNHHVFFNERGLHNHITHYLLSQTALAARPAQMERAYFQEQKLQRPQFPADEQVVVNMNDPEFFRSGFSQENHYHNYLTFFKRQIGKRGVGPVVHDTLFSRTQNAELHLARFLHPIIHFGFDVEFNQPAIIAEGLAQGAIHKPEISHVFDAIARYEKSNTLNMSTDRLLVDLIREIEQDDKIGNAACWGNGSHIIDDPLANAPEEPWCIAAQYRVSPVQLEEKTAEMINVCAYFTAAAQLPSKEHKLDFFFIHNVNCFIFFSAFLKKDWLSNEDKAHLLEMKCRFDIISYAARGSPHLDINEVINYQPKKSENDWEGLLRRVNAFLDDFHVTRVIRSLTHGEQVSKKYESQPGFPMPTHLFLQAAHIAMNSTEEAYYGGHWVRGAGFKEQWAKFKDRNSTQAASVRV